MIKKLDVWTLHRARASHISVQNWASFRTINAAHYDGKCISGLFKMHSRLCTSDRLWKSLVTSQKVDYKACELTKAFRHDFMQTSFTHYRSGFDTRPVFINRPVIIWKPIDTRLSITDPNRGWILRLPSQHSVVLLPFSPLLFRQLDVFLLFCPDVRNPPSVKDRVTD